MHISKVSKQAFIVVCLFIWDISMYMYVLYVFHVLVESVCVDFPLSYNHSVTMVKSKPQHENEVGKKKYATSPVIYPTPPLMCAGVNNALL